MKTRPTGTTAETAQRQAQSIQSKYCSKCSLMLDANGVCEKCEPDKVEKVKLPNNFIFSFTFKEFEPRYNKVTINGGVCVQYTFLWFSFSIFRYITEDALRFGLPKKRDLEREARR